MSHHLPLSESSRDPLHRMRAFQIAEELRPDTWSDAKTLIAEPLLEEIAKQLYAAVCSIAANIAEGYSRSSGKDRANKIRVCAWLNAREYALVPRRRSGSR